MGFGFFCDFLEAMQVLIILLGFVVTVVSFVLFFNNYILQFDCLYLETKNAVIEPDGGGAHL